MVLECEWLDNIPARGDDADNGIFLPQVRKNPESNFNKRSRFVFLEDCAPWNILLLPHDPSDPACDVFDVIDRERRYHRSSAPMRRPTRSLI